MDAKIIFFLAVLAIASAWTIPYYPVPKAPLRVTRYAPVLQHYRRPIVYEPREEQQRPKRDHHHDYDDHEHDHRDTKGITGPVHTFVKTDKNANYKWGVRHHVGNKYAS